MILFELYDPALGYAWPSRRYMADRLGATLPSISKWIGVLATSGALERVPASKVEPEVLKRTRRSAKRANYYKLDFGWAGAVLHEPEVDEWEVEDAA
jgi:hypothetical protein